MSPENEWRAKWEADGLHIVGITDLFPNAFSTAHLGFESDDPLTGTRTYRLQFARDKEPFCGQELVGPVHHLEQSLPATIRNVRVLSPNGVEVGYCAVPLSRSAT
jgi:hypothetical protein